MRTRNSALKIAVLVSILHCLLGNLIGATSDNSFIELVFLPYNFIAGMSNFAGWDAFSLLLELAGVLFMTLIFYPLGLLLRKTET